MERAARDALTADMIRLADGDRGAFPPVFERLWPVLRTFARRLLGDADGDDAAQQALFQIFARAHEFDPARDALPWALAVAANECRTVRQRRKRRREGPLEGAPEPAADARDPEAHALARGLDAALAGALGDLRPDDRATLLAILAGERPTGVAPATFRKRVERAMSRLRAVWSERHGEP